MTLPTILVHESDSSQMIAIIFDSDGLDPIGLVAFEDHKRMTTLPADELAADLGSRRHSYRQDDQFRY